MSFQLSLKFTHVLPSRKKKRHINQYQTKSRLYTPCILHKAKVVNSWTRVVHKCCHVLILFDLLSQSLLNFLILMHCQHKILYFLTLGLCVIYEQALIGQLNFELSLPKIYRTTRIVTLSHSSLEAAGVVCEDSLPQLREEPATASTVSPTAETPTSTAPNPTAPTGSSTVSTWHSYLNKSLVFRFPLLQGPQVSLYNGDPW